MPSIKACRNAHIPNYKGLALSGLVTDVTLLLIMLAGLLRLRSDDGTFIDLAYILWKQVGHRSCWLYVMQLTHRL